MALDGLDAIEAEATAHEAEAQATADEIENPPPLVDPAEAWAQIPMMIGGLLAIPMPELKNAFTEAACNQWGAAMAQVAEKYEWDAAETMSRFAPEIALIVSSIPLVLPTVTAIKARREDGRKPPEKTITAPGQSDDLPKGGGFSEPA